MTTFKSPTIALAMTLHDRPEKTLIRVISALRENPIDQLVVCLDGTTKEVEEDFWYATESLKICGDQISIIRTDSLPSDGWKCSAAAWNAAFAQVSTELLVCISSDVEMALGATTRLRDSLAAYPAVIFGKVVDENPEVSDQLKKGLTRKILCSSREPRPLGFIMGLPMWLVRATGGYDEGMMSGIWYEDSDWNQRLWNEGVPFVFDDNVSGIHISHPRPLLDTPRGVHLQNINMQYMAKKWGCINPFVKNQANLQYIASTGDPENGILYMLQTLHQEKDGATIGGGSVIWR